MKKLLVLTAFLPALSWAGEKTTEIEKINEVRREIFRSWDEGKVPGAAHSYELTGGQSEEGSKDAICHYVFKQRNLNYALKGADQKGKNTYNITRQLVDYQLGPKTTEKAEVCHSKANGVNDNADFGNKILAAMTLAWDQLNKDQKVKVVPVSIEKDAHAGFNIYHLTYHFVGETKSLEALLLPMDLSLVGSNVDAMVTFTFATGVLPAAWLWQLKFDGSVDGKSGKGVSRAVLKIDGADVPVYN